MGNPSSYKGTLNFNKSLTKDQLSILTTFLAYTDHNKDEYPADSTSLILTEDKNGIMIDPEQDDPSVFEFEWVTILIEKFFKPWDVTLNGILVITRRYDEADNGFLLVKENHWIQIDFFDLEVLNHLLSSVPLEEIIKLEQNNT